MIWEPFILALVLGIIISAGLYFAYLWPSVEPLEPAPDVAGPSIAQVASPSPSVAAAGTDDAASPPP